MENPDTFQIQQKIEALRTLHDNWDESSLELINDFDKTIAKLTIEQEYAALDITQRIVNRCKLEIRKISGRIAQDEMMDEVVRARLFERRKVYKYFLALFCKDFNKEMSEVEALIDRELSE